jgi:hypothetical protein
MQLLKTGTTGRRDVPNTARTIRIAPRGYVPWVTEMRAVAIWV